MTTNSSTIKEELQEYLKGKKLNGIFVAMVEALLIEKPENPIRYMVNYLEVRT